VVLVKLLRQLAARPQIYVSVLQVIQVQAALHVQLVHTSLQQGLALALLVLLVHSDLDQGLLPQLVVEL
jgi:hypothetical protein